MSYHTVLEFTFIEFDKNWSRAGTVQLQYTANNTAQLLVVAEGKTGVKTTYLFQMERGEIVLVSYDVNLVYIPSKCIQRKAGDATKCLKTEKDKS
ncbi:MAG: hypothetical protein WCE90_01735 [Candidatus Zixiibacteriota bacterium]